MKVVLERQSFRNPLEIPRFESVNPFGAIVRHACEEPRAPEGPPAVEKNERSARFRVRTKFSGIFDDVPSILCTPKCASLSDHARQQTSTTRTRRHKNKLKNSTTFNRKGIGVYGGELGLLRKPKSSRASLFLERLTTLDRNVANIENLSWTKDCG